MPESLGLVDFFDNLDAINAEAVASWLKPVPSLVQIENYLANKILYPRSLPQTKYEMQMDLAILRESLRLKGQSYSLYAALYKTSGNRMNYVTRARIRVEKDIVVRLVRTLPAKGELKVRVGQQVSPDEIIGTAFFPSGFRIVNVAKELSVNPKEAGKYLSKKLKSRIYKGELLAFKKGGLFGGEKIITAPTDGILEFLNPKTGEVKISFFPKKVSLPSGVFGIVEKVDHERSQLTIRTQVSRIRGVFGTGRPREGTLHILGKKEEVYSGAVKRGPFEEHILVGGSLFFKDTISGAISQGVEGLISGGINAADYRSMSKGGDIGITIVVCEGFGAVPIGDDIFTMLSSYQGKFVFIDGSKAIINLPSFSSDSLLKVRSTELSPLENEESLAKIELKAGLRVRIVGNSYFGLQGKLLAIDKSETLFPSGLKTILATIETPRKKIQVPVANLEAIV